MSASPLPLPPSLTFTVTAAMVEQFARLSGDRSSLHLDAVFARRSMYRENVVHGFLPLLFVTQLAWPQSLPAVVALEKFNGSFLKPVYAGETLIIQPTWLSAEGDGWELEWEIHHAATGAVVTTASARLRAASAAPMTGEGAECLVPTPLTEAAWELEQIEKGQTAGFPFVLTPGAIATGRALLAAGVGRETVAAPDASWLVSTLLSTLVGMGMPGQRATFLNFELNFQTPPPPHEACELAAKVAFKSATTSTIAQEITLRTASGKTVAQGKVHVRVNAPPSAMPTIETLRAQELDLGLRGRVALITGGSRGLGETAAKLLALHGVKVAVNYRHSRAEAERIVQEITAAGGTALAVGADVSQRAEVQAMVAKVEAALGPIHILVNNAVRDAQAVPFLELTWERAQADLDVVVQGAFHCCQAVLPGMIARQGGKIISLSTVFVEHPPAGQSKYVMSKSALVGLTRSLAVEFARHNIQCNLVVPSMVETDLSKGVPRIFSEKMRVETPMQRLATPADVAKAVVFLASRLSDYTTGQKIMVTGGNAPLL